MIKLGPVSSSSFLIEASTFKRRAMLTQPAPGRPVLWSRLAVINSIASLETSRNHDGGLPENP